METERPRAWREMVSTGLVVISLVLVMVEIRQNTNAQSAQAVQQLNQSMNEQFLAVAVDPDLADLFARAVVDTESLSATDKLRLEFWWLAVFNDHEAAHTFRARGMLDAEGHEGWTKSICGLLQLPRVSIIWHDHREDLNTEFVRETEERCGIASG